jgi:UDP-N-acetylmuramoyl-L-alanyl-D-glutamate--2,6-diaminopimelate ligase
MKLAELLTDLTACEIDFDVTGITLDSRTAQAGDAFFALNGAKKHGMSFAAQALANGVKAVIYDPAGWQLPKNGSFTHEQIAIADLDKHLGAIADRFYGKPSAQLPVIGITGTNGKTTCSQLIAQGLTNCGVIGTMGWGEPGNLLPTENTTPDAFSVHKLLKIFVEQQKQAVAMEVSSHGLQQGRVNAVAFQGAIFTNLSRDHLDYHGDMEAYFQAKLALFRNPALKFAVVNIDDAYADRVLGALDKQVQRWTFSSKGKVTPGTESLVAENIYYDASGITFDLIWRDTKIKAYTPLVGAFNLENALAVLCVLLAMNYPLSSAVARLAELKAITGRMEKFGGQGKPNIFVDYAHSPDALEKALHAAKGNGRLSVVFGCGGDRDKGKRREMGRIAEALADQVFITDDNPRSESSADIIQDILAGCQNQNIIVINDRKLAINTAIERAAKLDSVLIAGKGHENYQEIKGVKFPFSDQEVVKQSLALWDVN